MIDLFETPIGARCQGTLAPSLRSLAAMPTATFIDRDSGLFRPGSELGPACVITEIKPKGVLVTAFTTNRHGRVIAGRHKLQGPDHAPATEVRARYHQALVGILDDLVVNPWQPLRLKLLRHPLGPSVPETAAQVLSRLGLDPVATEQAYRAVLPFTTIHTDPSALALVSVDPVPGRLPGLARTAIGLLSDLNWTHSTGTPVPETRYIVAQDRRNDPLPDRQWLDGLREGHPDNPLLRVLAGEASRVLREPLLMVVDLALPGIGEVAIRVDPRQPHGAFVRDGSEHADIRSAPPKPRTAARP